MRILHVQILSVFLGVFLMSGCYYDATVEQEVTTDVSFSADIIPVFNQSCNATGCHSAGAVKPDLTPANAYNALVSGNYLDVVSPENSDLYRWMRGERSVPMPLSGPNANYNALVLAWIKQGALRNA